MANPYIGYDGLTKLYNETAEKKLSKSSIHRRLKSMGIHTVKVNASTADLQNRKQYPRSQTVFRFEVKPEKKKRQRKKSEPVETNERPENEGMPEALLIPEEFLFPAMAFSVPSTIIPPELSEGHLTDDIQIIVYPPGRSPIQLQ